MSLPDSILKSHQVLAQTIVNVFSSLLEDDDGEVSSPISDLVKQDAVKTVETAFNQYAANVLNLVAEPCVVSSPSVSNPIVGNNLLSEPNVASASSEPVVCFPALDEVAEVSEVAISEQTFEDPVDDTGIVDVSDCYDERPVVEPVVLTSVFEDLECKSICSESQEGVLFADNSSQLLQPPVRAHFRRLCKILKSHSLKKSNDKAKEKVGNRPWVRFMFPRSTLDVWSTVLSVSNRLTHHRKVKRLVGLWPNAIT